MVCHPFELALDLIDNSNGGLTKAQIFPVAKEIRNNKTQSFYGKTKERRSRRVKKLSQLKAKFAEVYMIKVRKWQSMCD